MSSATTARTCARDNCDQPFLSAAPHAMYCSARCREASARKRKRANDVILPTPGEIMVDADHVDDLAALLAERGLVLDEWVVVGVTVNRYEGFYKDVDSIAVTVPLRQLKVRLVPKKVIEFCQPATISKLPAYALPAKRGNRATKLWFIYGDDQRPHVDRDFERLKLDWVRDNQPDEIVDLGDGMDLPTVSMHKVNPAMDWSVQECANDYASWLHAVVSAAPNARVRVLADNHVTGRLRDYQLGKAAALYGIRPADVPGLKEDLEPLWSVSRLLRLDELGVEYVAPPGDTHYAESQLEVVPGELVALHGYRTGAGLGKKFIDDYGCSVIYGHQHGHDTYTTDKNRRGVGRRKRLYAFGVGCGGNLHGGGGFAPGADWQNSALTVSVFPDGGWTVDTVYYEHGVLRWRDRQYT